jgi:diguanylate cyclase (GGDEF)-like protein
MDHVFTNLQMLGLLVQAMGALLIGSLCLMLNRVVSSAALSAWSRGWLSLTAALVALLAEQAAPQTAAGTLPIYLFGEYLFGYWIVKGCAHFGNRRWPRGPSSVLLVSFAIVAALAPQLIGFEFRRIFLMQAFALACIFAAALYAMGPASARTSRSAGIFAIRTALSLLIIVFFSYLPIFGSNLWLDEPLPLTLLRISSAAHLVLEFVLGFGGAVLVLEQSYQGLEWQNDALASDMAKLRGQAERDALTNAYNRHALLERLTHALEEAACSAAKVTLIFLDLDHFKDVNDTYGHAFGDQLLIAVAHRLQQCVGEDDLVVRMGGDEFVVITGRARDRDAVGRLAEQIKAVLGEPLTVGEVAMRVSCSMGIAVYPDDGGTADLLLQYADIALYEAKAAGRNGFRCFSAKMNEINQERVFLTRSLADAIGTEQLFIDYQPVVDLPTGRIIGLEALARWRHPQRGLIPPNDFIAIAEQSCLIEAIGENVLRHVCGQVKAWQADFVPLVPVAVNVSPRQFEQGRLADMFVRVIKDFDIDPTLIRIEITENGLMRNLHEHAKTLQRLRDFGVTISIDDFGTGHSSLRYLKELPIDCLKIDRSFVAHIIDDERDTAIVRAAINIAHSMGIVMVAEGVEFVEQAQRLRELGCVAAQGYLFHRPMAADACKTLLEDLAKDSGSPIGRDIAPLSHLSKRRLMVISS